MRIGSRNNVGRNAPVSKAREPRKVGRSFAVGQNADQVERVASADTIASAEPVRAVDAVLAMQEVEGDPRAVERDQVRQWGNDVLERLSLLRDGLLMGNIPPERLERLVESLGNRKTYQDRELQQVADEIELRARIELAKMEQQRTTRIRE